MTLFSSPSYTTMPRNRDRPFATDTASYGAHSVLASAILSDPTTIVALSLPVILTSSSGLSSRSHRSILFLPLSSPPSQYLLPARAPSLSIIPHPTFGKSSVFLAVDPTGSFHDEPYQTFAVSTLASSENGVLPQCRTSILPLSPRRTHPRRRSVGRRCPWYQAADASALGGKRGSTRCGSQ